MTRFQKYIKQVEEGDKGFTLIELMVVVLIIGILMAIAIPTFLSAKKSANSAATESNIQSAITAEQTYFTNNQAYSGKASDLATSEPGVSWATVPASGAWSPSHVYAAADTNGTQVAVMAMGGDNKCYYAIDTNGSVAYEISATTPCTIPAASATPTGWAASWKDAAANPVVPASTQPAILALTSS